MLWEPEFFKPADLMTGSFGLEYFDMLTMNFDSHKNLDRCLIRECLRARLIFQLRPTLVSKMIRLAYDRNRIDMALTPDNRQIAEIKNKQWADYKNWSELVRNRMQLLNNQSNWWINGSGTIDRNRSKHGDNQNELAKGVLWNRRIGEFRTVFYRSDELRYVDIAYADDFETKGLLNRTTE